MSPNRKADLQRKLAMAPLPKPPAGLAERIKSDIPRHLLVDTRKERQRLSQSVAFNMRVAASVIFLVLSVYLALHVLSRAERETAARRPATPVATAAKAQPPQTLEAKPQQLPVMAAAPPPARVAAREKEQGLVAEAKPEERSVRRDETRQGVAGGVAGGVVGGVAGGVAGAAAPSAQIQAAPLPAPPPPPPATAAAAPRPAEGVADAVPAPRVPTAKAAAAPEPPGLMSEANAAPFTLTPTALFGIALPAGEAKGAASIQHFAAPPAPPRSLRVDTEAAMLDDRPLLRVSVDVPDVPRPSGGSRPPVAAGATLDVQFDDDAVSSHRAIVGATPATEAALPAGSSVTALYAFELNPELSRRAVIATVRLRYRSVTDGREHEITRKVRRSDVRQWDDASRRMKSASLAAALYTGLDSPAAVVEKARAARLEELASAAERARAVPAAPPPPR